MTLVATDSSSSFTEPPSSEGSHSHMSYGAAMTPTKSLTPRYSAVHTLALQSQALRPIPRREPRHRVVVGGAPPERYLEPLPQHVSSQPVSGTSLGNSAQLKGSSASMLHGVSPVYRNLATSPHSNSHTATASSSPVGLASTVQHASSSSCLSLRPQPCHAGSAVNLMAAPLSIESRMIPSPLAPSLGPASPQMPRPPSIGQMNERGSNPRSNNTRPSSISPQRIGLTAASETPSGHVDDDDHQLSYMLHNLMIPRVDSIIHSSKDQLALLPVSSFQSGNGGGGATAHSPPALPHSFRGRGIARLGGALHDLEDGVASDGVGSSHGSPFSSFRLEGSARGGWEVPSPRYQQQQQKQQQAQSPGSGLTQPLADIPMHLVEITPSVGSPSISPGGGCASPNSSSGAMNYACSLRDQAISVANDNGVTFYFYPRNGAACTVDSLEEECLTVPLYGSEGVGERASPPAAPLLT